jgi:hypothetical protein
LGKVTQREGAQPFAGGGRCWDLLYRPAVITGICPGL